MLSSEDYLNIFHEIKNSITLISSSLQLVAKKHPEVTSFDYWNETMSEITFLRDMVTELSSARLTNRNNIKPTNLHDLMNNILHSISALISADFNCQFHFSGKEQPVEMDTLLMKQAIINLMKNGYEAMDNSGLLLVDILFEDTSVQISVTDHGNGLDPSFADNIFEPFITSKTGGSGLGLAITKQIVEFHHGTISYESRPGDGCTFFISLPFTQN